MSMLVQRAMTAALLTSALIDLVLIVYAGSLSWCCSRRQYAEA
jgi:hypothetical protein